MWIRHVVVPHITLNKEYLYELGLFIGQLKMVKALDILHIMIWQNLSTRNLAWITH